MASTMSLTDGRYIEVSVSTITTAAFSDTDLVILKLVAKLDTAMYSIWIKPPKSTHTLGTAVLAPGLECQNGELFRQGRQVPSVPLETALLMFHAFLTTAPLPVILIDYSSEDLGKMLLTLIEITGFVDLFHGVIVGFTGTYDLWKNHVAHDETNDNVKLSRLVSQYLEETYESDGFETTYRSIYIENLAKKLSSMSEIIANSVSYEEAFARAMQNPRSQHVYQGLEPLLSAAPETVLKAMSRERLSYSTLKRIFEESTSSGLEDFLTRQSNLYPLLSADDNKILRNIVQFFEKQYSYSSRAEPLTGAQDVMMDDPSSSPIDPMSAFIEQLNSPNQGEIPIFQHQHHQDQREQVQRDREIIDQWNQSFQ